MVAEVLLKASLGVTCPAKIDKVAVKGGQSGLLLHRFQYYSSKYASPFLPTTCSTTQCDSVVFVCSVVERDTKK